VPEVIGNRFECHDEIGRGTDSIVYRGRDRLTGSTVAIKLIPVAPGAGTDDLRREIAARARCESPHILPIIAWGSTETDEGARHYVVTPHLDGETLAARLSRGAPSENEARKIAIEIASALNPIHEAGLLHSDLKPANIFFTSDGQLRLLDFGLARGIQHTGSSGGTACYAAPEQLLGQQCDGRTDLYALGCILHEMLTGRPPFVSDDVTEVLFDQVNTPPSPPSRHRPDLSPFINAVILTLLEKSPDGRFPSALELQQVLEGGESCAWWSERVAAMSEADADAGSRWRQSRPWPSPLVGHGTELHRLSGWVEDAIEHGAGCFVVVDGAAGVGKTRLTEEVLAGFSSQAFVLTSRCIKFDTRVPYLPLIGLVDDLANREKFDSTRLQRFLTRHLPRTPLLVPKFMEFLTKQAQVESTVGALTTDNLLYLFTSLFHHLAGESPLILFIDDLHWAEPSTCNFLRYFVRNITDVPLVLLGAYRPEELAATGETEPPPSAMLRDLAMEPNFETLSLNALSARESQELVTTICGPAVGNELAPQLYRKTEGNPCYLLESIAHLREQGVILGEGAKSRVASSVSEISIPSTVADLLGSRLAYLSDEDRELLEYASIQGPIFRSDLLAYGTETDRLKLLRRLARIEREHRIVRSREAGYAFDHQLIYEYLYHSISPDLRAAYHRQVAETIEASGEPGEETVYLLADHFSRGGDHAKASEYLLKAARLSMAKYSGAEALETLHRAKDHFSRLPISQRSDERGWEMAMLQAEIAAHLGDNPQEEAALRDMERLAESCGTPEKALDVVERKADFALRVSRFDDALNGFDNACALARELNDSHRLARLTHKTGATHREMMRWDDAMRFLKEALDLARESGDSHEVGIILKDIGTVKTKQTKWREATVDYSHALPLLREAGDRREEAFALNGLAVSLFCAGDRQAALERWEEANRIFESIGYPSGQSNILHNLGVTYSNLGQMDRAIECLRSALRLRQSIGMRHAQVSTLNRLGFVHYVMGLYDSAAENLRSALTIAREIAADLGCIEIYYHFTRLAIAQGDHDAAQEHIRQGWKMLGETSDPYHEAHLRLAQATLALARGETAEASRNLHLAAQAEVNDPQLLAQVFIHHAWAAEAEHRSDDADRFIEKYLELSRDCPFIYARMTSALILHTIYSLRRDEKHADEALNALRSELALIDAGTKDPRLREAFYARWGKYMK